MIELKFCISNIAWEAKDDESVYRLMRSNGYEGLEIAPTRVWDNPYGQGHSDYAHFKQQLNRYGIELTAMQSLLYREESLQLFHDESSRREMLAALEKRAVLAEMLGIRSMVFGLPKNRSYSGIDNREAFEIAADFFRQAGEMAEAYHTAFCIEAVPESYGTNFINSTAEALELVKHVGCEGFRLHLDTGTIIGNKENLSVIAAAAGYISHVHISEPFLDIPVSQGVHAAVGRELRETGYTGFISIEMKRRHDSEPLTYLESVLGHVREWYA
ncbi:sugar phosphate isomerase/epimerase family protein [Paenibacillus piri]|uniref:Sugar phosphate isomerase/epimerase n=1 Tax=Paenibacillus piri TaxID=2547395 RepID=A0A4R5KLF5_9BACL|nr:sugar phosphate isomerase/epimerase family protein [Paenibacillus piri]TDF96336.1 sugar phosphate isomerase/epimerase [Paenibacillus piri]